MQASNRKLEDWYGKIQRGEIKLPRFQRHEAWDRRRIASLFNTVTQDLPLGITLVLEIGEKEPFISRHLVTAPENNGKVMEHLLDGQQRLTALWRVLHNNYEDETYYVFVPEFDNYGELDSEEQFINCQTRWMKRGELYPLWCGFPAKCLKRGMIPTNLLRPEDIGEEVDIWINEATMESKPDNPEKLEAYYDWKGRIKTKINDLRAIVKNYNLPYLSLPSSTQKDIALDVFINMNTNSKPLSQYDIVVAEIESVMEASLHDLQNDLDKRYPNIKHYWDLSFLILNTSALLQEKLPNQRGVWDMDKAEMVRSWQNMEKGLNEMAVFLHNEGILDRDRLPTNAVLSVIAALFPFIPDKGDERGACEILLRKYVWRSFFTDRYENSAPTNAYADYIALKRIFTKTMKPDGSLFSEDDVPVLNPQRYTIADVDELLTATWPNRDTIRGRGILAVACRNGAYDFADGSQLTRENIGNRHYHHVFPKSILENAVIDGNIALNCALITDTTNYSIGNKEPLVYLKERFKWASPEIVNERLASHLIPVQQLSNGGYENCTSEQERKDKLKTDFDAFIRARAEMILGKAALLCDGHHG